MANRHLENSWDGFRYFLAVARTGTLSAAAAQLKTEHTTVSRHIRLLEQGLKIQLFHRSNQGYELTDEGNHFLAQAEEIESAVISAQAAAPGNAPVSGIVRIGAPDGFGTFFLAALLPALTEKYPGLEIELFATARQFSLLKREADIAITLSAPSQTRVVSRRLTDFRLFLYAAEPFLARVPRITSLADVRRLPFVSYTDELVFNEVDYLSALGGEVRPQIRSVNLVAQAYATARGAGMCILPSYVGHRFPELRRVLADEFSLTRALHLHIHEDQKRAPHIAATRDFIVETIRQHAAMFEA